MITATDLLEPIGDLALAYFPGKPQADVEALLGAYIADGVARLPAEVSALGAPTTDLAVTAWSYYRAYRNITMRLSRDPATVHIEGEVATTITGEQIRTFKDETARWLADWSTLIAVEAFAPGSVVGTVAVPNSYTF